MLRASRSPRPAGERRVRALSAAWLAHLDYLEQDFEPMVRHLGIALPRRRPGSTSALARACLVTAQAYHWAERFDLAQPWYARARQHATDEGDETLLSALMHNMAWLRCRGAADRGQSAAIDRDQVRELLLGADSTGHFDQRVGTASLRSLVPMLRAHVLILLDVTPRRCSLFEPLSTALAEGLAAMRVGHAGGDRPGAGCRSATLPARDGTRRKPATSIAECVQPGDRAAVHGRLAQVFAGARRPRRGGIPIACRPTPTGGAHDGAPGSDCWRSLTRAAPACGA